MGRPALTLADRLRVQQDRLRRAQRRGTTSWALAQKLRRQTGCSIDDLMYAPVRKPRSERPA